MAASAEGKSKVRGFVQGTDVLVWNAEDVVWLREEWRIVGSLVGSLAGHPRQNIHLGLPLSLSPDEATLLSELGVLELCTYTPAHSPSGQDSQRFTDLRQLEIHRQEAEYWQERRKYEYGEEWAGPSKRPKMGGGAGSFSPLICIHTADPSLVKCSCATWSYPSTETEELRYAVFKDLWSQGKFVTSGTKYGGEFLVYSGDPCLVHAETLGFKGQKEHFVVFNVKVVW